MDDIIIQVGRLFPWQ